MKDFREELNRLPDLPGIYLMKDKEDHIIYVGKAKNLKNRVKSYFNKDKNKPLKVQKMVEKIDDFEYIIVKSEVEALVLESNFIKEHRPHYNILLRDDKQYPYIMITKEKFPRIVKVRSIKNDGNLYYGPYPNAFAVNDIIDLLHSSFKIRNCNLNFDKGQSLDRPCLNYFINKCPAPCVGLADESLYMENINKAKDFLSGNSKILTDYLEKEMIEASSQLEFEKAAKFRDYMISVDQIMERQKINIAGQNDIDLISLYKRNNFVTIQIFFMRNGKVIDQEYFIIEDRYADKEEDIMSSFMKQFYLDITYVPKEILLEVMPSDIDSITALLEEKRSSKVNIRVPQRGDKKDLLKVVRLNARETMLDYLKKREKRERSKTLGLKHLEEMLNIYPLDRIEMYDISNTSGVQSVGSMVVYEMGSKSPKEYRKFKIRGVEGSDDYASMEEVLIRRLKRGIKEVEKNNTLTGFGKLPSLIILDGGRGHVNVGKKVLKSLQLNIPLIGLSKDSNHKTDSLVLDGENIKLEKNTALYRFLYDIQEEVHRFALNYHNTLRSKSITDSQLSNIKGVGQKRIQNLIKHFGSIDEIKKASREELQACPGISQQIASNIFEYFQKEG